MTKRQERLLEMLLDLSDDDVAFLGGSCIELLALRFDGRLERK